MNYAQVSDREGTWTSGNKVTKGLGYYKYE